MVKLSRIWLFVLVFSLWFGSNSVEASRAKRKANKKIAKLLEELFTKIRVDDAIAVADAMKAYPELLDSKGGGGQTPLMASVLMGSSKCVEYLLSLGADASIPEKDGYTPMHGAGFQGRAEIAKLLLAEGLDPSAVHSDGYLPVHRAAWGMEQRHTDTVKVFIDAGVDVCLEKASNGQIALTMTKNHRTKALLESQCSGQGSGSNERELQTVDDDQTIVTKEELQKQKSIIRSKIQNNRAIGSTPMADSTENGMQRMSTRKHKKRKGGRTRKGNRERSPKFNMQSRKKERKVSDDDDD